MTQPFDLAGKVALVTGASRGIGRAIALGYAAAGADLVVTARAASSLDGVVDAIRALGRDAIAVAADLGTAEGASTVATSALAWKGAVDVLVNNAGTSEPGAFVDSDDASFDRVFALNVDAGVRITRAIGRAMLARKRGSVIFVGSVLGRTAIPGNASYYASKGAIEAFARGLAVEWARSGVRVNTLAPGFVDTDLVSEVREPGGLGDYAKRRTPMRRVAVPEEMVSAALFLACDASSFVTGSTVNVDGGWLAG